jgi:uncharacterized RDD family membrane protein YckC
MSNATDWAGKRLGLPQAGAGSLAKIGRRALAIGVDWGIAMLLAKAFFGYENLAILTIFFAQTWLFIVTTGSSLGHRLFGLRVQTLDGLWIGPWRAAVRQLLILLVIPATIWDADNRGLHDKAAGTVLVRR